MDFLSPDSLMWFLAQAEKAPGFLSKKVIVIVLVLIIIVGGIYWYRGRGAK
ncbi:MAG TPA: hypothetical protein ACFYD3_00270 [Candidatus Hypogeohydataceae bacterium YC41]